MFFHQTYFPEGKKKSGCPVISRVQMESWKFSKDFDFWFEHSERAAQR